MASRLGVPANVYESGRIVSYVLYLHDNRFGLQDLPGSACYGLVIAYGDDGQIVRRAIRPPPGRPRPPSCQPPCAIR
jgi:hypothetical protein